MIEKGIAIIHSEVTLYSSGKESWISRLIAQWIEPNPVC